MIAPLSWYAAIPTAYLKEIFKTCRNITGTDCAGYLFEDPTDPGENDIPRWADDRKDFSKTFQNNYNL